MADGRRILIVNADDFGRTPSVNEGILRSHEHGIVTSASLMVRWPAARAAAARARDLAGLSIGLHLDLGEWLSRNGHWSLVYRVVPLDDPLAVAIEARRQLAEFRRLLGRDPTHLDSHQHVHNDGAIAGVLGDLAGELGVPLREHDARVRFEGGFFGQESDGTPVLDAITAEGLEALLDEVPSGITELCCHPGMGRDSWSVYDRERADEVGTLCDPAVRAAVAERAIELWSFADLAR
jgi:chitin disaccharide deacetylase